MKKLFFILLPLLVVACKGVEQYRTGIEELSGNWDNTTKAVTDFQASVSSDLTNYTQALAALQPADVSKLTPEQVTGWEASQKAVTDALGAFAPLQKTIADFVDQWSQKTAEVTALKDGLAAGKIEGDAGMKLTELNNMVTTANENLTAWQASYATVKNGVETAMSALKGMAPASGTIMK